MSVAEPNTNAEAERARQRRQDIVYNLLAARSRMFEKQLETRRGDDPIRGVVGRGG
jgi:hypothetical protein